MGAREKEQRVLQGLRADFQLRVEETLRIARQSDVDMLAYCGVRTPEEQARLYRRSRTTAEIEAKMQSLRDRGYPRLADIVREVGPQYGRLGAHVTAAAPGESWHQFGLAVDCVPLQGGKALWSTEEPEWKIYGEAASYVGLRWAGMWTTFPEYPHIQRYPEASPLSHWRSEIDLLRNLIRKGQS